MSLDYKIDDIDLSVPEGIPHTLVLTSDQGKVKIGDYDLLKVSRATIRMLNGVRVYRETGKRTGTTYAGNQQVTGQVTKAMLNAAEHRIALGVESNQLIGGERFFNGPGVLTPAKIEALMSYKEKSFPYNPSENTNFYPLRVNLEFEINSNKLANLSTTDQETIANDEGLIHRIVVKRALITSTIITYDSRGIITSGPIDFRGSAIEWKAVEDIPQS